MASPDWESIKQIFSEALNVPTPVRDAYLERACDGRVDVQRAVTDLLRAHTDASQSFLEPDSIVVRAGWLFAQDECIAGRFRVRKPIARGSMGEVYHVYDERLRLDVALKAIRPELLSESDSVERFRREVLVTRDIAHDGLCRVFDLVEHPMPPRAGFPAGTVIPCLTMQLLDGTNLEDWLAAHRPMPVAEAMRLVRQIADALQVLHDAGVVHRDLKPSNVMLVPSGSGLRAVLTDFGLAKALEAGVFETQAPVHGGAPFFMAPELFRGERPSRASDIYALGLLIDEMVTGTRAFSASSLHSLLLEKLSEGPTAPSTRAVGLPSAWDDAIVRCLAPDPAARPGSAHLVVEALSRQRVPFWRRSSVRLLRHRPGRRVATYSGVAAIALSGIVVFTPPPPSTTTTSVAIFPFTNLTGEPENDYLAAGTAGELGRRLSRLSGWRVFAIKDGKAATDLSTRAAFALRGHIQESGATLRITAELTHVTEGTLLWSQNFEGSRGRALRLEDDLAADAMNAVAREAAKRVPHGPLDWTRRTLTRYLFPRRGADLPSQGTTRAEAYDAYLRGRYLFEERDLTPTLDAIKLFKRAIALDPGFAAPYSGLADAQSALMDLHYAPHGQLLSDAERYATQAVALDPNLPEAQLSLAAVRQMQSRWSEAEDAYRQALDLHPAFARAHRWFGGMLLQFGRFAESLPEYERALELDPYDIPSQSGYGLALFYARRPLDAVSRLEHLITVKDYPHARFVLGQVSAYLIAAEPVNRVDHLRRALAQADALRHQNMPATDRYADLVSALAWSYQGDAVAAQPFLQALEAPDRPERASPSFAARIYAVQGRAPEALAALEAAEAERDRELMYMTVSPLYDRIRAEPRFGALAARMNLTSQTGAQ